MSNKKNHDSGKTLFPAYLVERWVLAKILPKGPGTNICNDHPHVKKRLSKASFLQLVQFRR
jgi:hypothetical protein